MDTAEEAVDYDTMDHSTVNRLFVEDLLRTLEESNFTNQKNETATVLDLGTGTALIPLELLRQQPSFTSILACDLSAEMLKVAVQHICREQTQGTILPLFCDCKRLPLSDQSCDIVMSNSIVHHIPQPIDVFREMKRVIRPHGSLFIRDLMRPQSSEDVEQIVTTYAGSDNAHQQQLFRQSLHAALTVDEVRELLRESDLPSANVAATSDRHWTISFVAR